ncbi:ferroxidase fet3 [Marasmius crinis-equi]|uniref:Ferroxidase fet3 n=1 Tax=Marasmius crinis-equi TaxID=585013 RepID=A0ABR3FJY5_9AGAR
MDNGINRAMFSQIEYNSPNVPVILSALMPGFNPVVEGAYGLLSFVVSDKEVVDLVVKNGDAGKHPFRLRGDQPFVFDRVKDYISTDPTLNPLTNLTSSMRRDMFHIPSGS